LPPILSFDDRELAALRSAAAALLPEQRARFLRDVARELGRCRKVEPSNRTGHTVAQVATAVQHRLSNGISAQRMWQAQDRASNRNAIVEDRERAGPGTPLAASRIF
jgi:hypothetical protein